MGQRVQVGNREEVSTGVNDHTESSKYSASNYHKLQMLQIVAMLILLPTPEFGSIGHRVPMKLVVLLRIAFKRAPGPFCAKLAR